MKKYIIGFLVLFLTACSFGKAVTPKQKVSEFLDRYKNESSEVISQLDETVNNEFTDSDFKDRYKTLMRNQYKNMKYEIKDEIVEDDNAVVEAEITVYDYASAIKNANIYLNEHIDEFKAEVKEKTEDVKDAIEGEDNTDNVDYDESKFLDYKIKSMEDIVDTVKYTIEFTLTKVNGEWQLDALSNSDIEKLHGIYIE